MASTTHAQVRRDRSGGVSNTSVRLAVWALLIVATLWLSLMAAGDGALNADVRLTRFVQDYSSSLTNAVAQFGNAFGSATVGVPAGIGLALLLFWRGHPQGGALLLAATVLRVVNYGLKALFDSPRPTDDLVRVETTRDSNGFPSGHAQGATLLCGALLIALWPLLTPRQRIIASAAAFMVVAATAFARISVGAHWPTDVLGGFLWGVILLALAVYFFKRTRDTSDAPVQPE